MAFVYQRKTPSDLRGNDDVDGYIRPKEFVDPDEDAVIAQLVRDTVAGTRRQPKGSGKNDPTFHEPHWGHGTGLLRGTLEIDRVDALPERFRVGLFSQNRAYRVVSRPNYIHDKQADFKASRIALKVEYPDPLPNVYAPSGEARELDLLLAEGSPEDNGVGHAFFFRDAREMSMFFALMPPSMRTLSTLVRWRNWGQIVRVFKRLKPARDFLNAPAAMTTGWAGKSYYSAGPFRLGEGAMKFCLTPRQSHAMEPLDAEITAPVARQRAAMEAWVAAGREAVFDLRVQLATSAAIPSPGPGDPPKSVMAAEYCDLNWDESESPYVAVGTLTFPATADSDLSTRMPWSPLQFNAWNTLPSMRPLGQLFRARKHVHKGHAEFRLEHIYEAEPGAMVDKAPFADEVGGAPQPGKRAS